MNRIFPLVLSTSVNIQRWAACSRRHVSPTCPWGHHSSEVLTWREPLMWSPRTQTRLLLHHPHHVRPFNSQVLNHQAPADTARKAPALGPHCPAGADGHRHPRGLLAVPSQGTVSITGRERCPNMAPGQHLTAAALRCFPSESVAPPHVHRQSSRTPWFDHTSALCCEFSVNAQISPYTSHLHRPANSCCIFRS